MYSNANTSISLAIGVLKNSDITKSLNVATIAKIIKVAIKLKILDFIIELIKLILFLYLDIP